MNWLILLAADDPAGTGAEHAEVLAIGNWLPGVTALVVFLLAFAILATVVWPKIARGLDDRNDKIRSDIAAAEKARTEAKVAMEQYDKQLQEARAEANDMIAKAKDDARVAGEELRKRNEAELVEMKQRATREIQTAKQGAIAEIHAEATTLATAIAGKILQREISAGDQQQLVEESLRELANTRS